MQDDWCNLQALRCQGVPRVSFCASRTRPHGIQDQERPLIGNAAKIKRSSKGANVKPAAPARDQHKVGSLGGRVSSVVAIPARVDDD